MFGSFFNTAAADEFADWIVAEVKRALPPGYSPGTKNIASLAENLNQNITKRTAEFKQVNPPLNIYKKARLAARVREGMTAHGYPEPFVKSFSYDILTRLQRSPSVAKPQERSSGHT
jgi:hypothetical protein